MLKLVTSNKNKLNEFRRLGLTNLTIEKGLDLPEVDADSTTVIIYKALSAGGQHVVEDTSLHIEGVDVGINVRWLLDTVTNYNGRAATWEVLLGVHRGEIIDIYQGAIKGTITAKYVDEPKGFGFDNYFIPNGETLTLYELELVGRKDEFSARKSVVTAFLEGNKLDTVNVADIPLWQGKMQ